MKINVFLLFIVCGLISTEMIAQTLPSSFDVYLPEFIKEMNGNPSGINEDQQWQEWCLSKIKKNDFGKNTKTIWTAYSDRESNPTYTTPNSSANKHSVLQFGEKVYIAKIQNGYALVFTDDFGGSNYPKINSTALSKGWIPVDNLLLWEVCPKSKNQIYQKGLVVHDPSKQSAFIEQNPSYYLSPSQNSDKNPNQKAKDLDILFIMKSLKVGTTTYYLLSKEMSINNMEKRVLYGWLPDDYLTSWDQRLVFEPTYATVAVRNYMNDGIKPSIFSDANTASSLYSQGITNNPFWVYNDFGPTRMDAYLMRNPIIEKDNDREVYKVAAISSLLQKEKGDYIEEIEMLKEQLNNINVIFVIDATSSMKKYYPAVANALSDIMRRDFNQKIRVGAVLYKDYKDPDCIKHKPITNNINELAGFITSNAENIGSIDPDDYEAMFLGLETALDLNKMKYSKDHANFLILIGDAGNHRRDNNGNDWQSVVTNLSQKMSNNNINFLAYQVNNANRTAYEDFAIQVGVLQKQLSEHIRKKLKIKEGGIEYALTSNRFYTLVRKSNQDNELPVYDTYKYASSGQSETTGGLQKIIINTIVDFQKVIENRLINLQQNDFGISSDGNLKETKLKENLLLGGWNEDKINKYITYLKQGGSTKLLGYAPEKVSTKKHKLFDYVLFFTEDELKELIQVLSKLNSPTVISQRKSYQDAVISMGQAMLGHFDSNRIQNMDMDELLSQIYGVPIKIQSCGIKIDRIIQMDQSELDVYIKKFNDKLHGLKNILQNNYDGRFRSNGVTYYWIPFSEMPGYCDEF